LRTPFRGGALEQAHIMDQAHKTPGGDTTAQRGRDEGPFFVTEITGIGASFIPQFYAFAQFISPS
jgi:hypothetical protein